MIDFEGGAQEVLDCALQYSEMHGASVHFIHVRDRPSFLSGLDDVALMLPETEGAEEARIALLSFLDQSDRRGLAGFPLVRSGKREREVAAAAEELGVDPIIISADGGGNRRWGRGPAEKVVRKARCPVLILQPED